MNLVSHIKGRISAPRAPPQLRHLYLTPTLMSFAPNSMVVGSFVNTNGSRPLAASAASPRSPPKILTYCYNSKLVYVTPGNSYDQAIDYVLESFPELITVNRKLISLEVRVVLNSEAERKTAKIGRMAWSSVVATLAQYEIVEIRVASPPPTPPPSDYELLVNQPPAYAPRAGLASEMKGSSTSEASFGSAPSHQSHQCSFTTRVAGLFGQRSHHSHSS